MFPIRDTIPSRHPPIATWSLILLNGVVFFFELALPEHQLERVFYLFGVVPARYTHPAWAQWAGFSVDDYWPFLSSMFLHGGWFHIIINMWTLWIFGDNVEDRMGPVRFLIFYLLCGVTAGVIHLLANPGSTVPTVGASGAIAGVMGAYFILFPNSYIITVVPIFFWPFFFELPAFFYLGFWFLSQFFSGTFAIVASGQVGGIAWWAHIGGFITGILIHRIFKRPRTYRHRFEPDEWGIEGAWGRYW